MTVFPNVAAIDAEGHDPDGHCKITFPYEVGRVAIPLLDRTIQLAVTRGVTVRDERFSGGIFAKQGRVHAEGRWGDVRALLVAIERLAADLD